MDRGVSPSPSSAHSSQDLSRPRRSVASYRLFPIVEPTPPASPTTLQRNTLSRASGSSRRRSTSSDHGARQSLLASGQTILPATTFSAAGRKGSLPELRPLRTSNSREPSRPSSRRAPKSASDVRAPAGDSAYYTRFNSAPDDPADPTGLSQQRAALHAFPGRQHPSAHINQDQPDDQRQRAKTKPHLRIAIAKNENRVSQPPPPLPPKSPRHRKDDAGNVATPKRDSHSPLSPATSTVPSYMDPPQTPRHQASVAQQLPVVGRSGGVRVRELTVPSRARNTSEQSSPKMRSRKADDSDSPLFQLPATKFSPFPTISRPKTSNGPVPEGGVRTSFLPAKRSLANLRLNNLSSANISRPLASPPFVPSVFSNDAASATSEVSAYDNFPSTTRHTYRARHAEDDRSPAPSVSDSIADVNRMQSADHSQVSEASLSAEVAHSRQGRSPNAVLAAVAAARARVAALQNVEPSLSTPVENAKSDPPTKRAASAALAAIASARANAAALQDFDSPLASPRIVTHGVSPSSECGSMNRFLATEVLSGRPSMPGQTDPIETLENIAEQIEALHARYASLRMERQKISGGIIANLKDQKPGPEYCNMLLHEQLSLAAISSSMDICIAKLKSLECRREDSIAALIVQTTQAKTSAADNMASTIASMAISRKPSFAPSLDSGSRFVQTGRSTPDMSADGLSATRSTCSSFPRTLSYTSDADIHDYRLSSYSRKPSLGSDLVEESIFENGLKIGESPKARRRSPLGEPSEALEELKEEGDSMNEETQRVVSPLSRVASFNQLSQHNDLSTVDEHYDQPKRTGVDGTKASRVLGLSNDEERSSRFKRPDEVANGSPVKQQRIEAEMELYPVTYTPTLRSRVARGPVTSSTPGVDAPLENPFARTDDFDTSSLHDLDTQLGNFPKPAPSVPPKDKQSLPPSPVPPPPPPKHNTTHGEQQQTRRRRNDSPMDLEKKCSVRSNTRRPLSQKSAYTIEVYLDQDQDDLRELERLRSAATAVS